MQEPIAISTHNSSPSGFPEPSSPSSTLHYRGLHGLSLLVPRGCDGGSLEQSGKASPYQLEGTPTSVAGPPVLCQEHDELPCSSEDRQYSSSSQYQQDGRCTFERCTFERSLLRMWNWCIHHQITISAEHLPGSQNQVTDRESRSKADSCKLALDSYTFEQVMDKRPLHTRPLYLSLWEASHLLQLEIGSRGNSREYPVPTLWDIIRLCFLAFLHDRHAGAWPRSPRKKAFG